MIVLIRIAGRVEISNEIEETLRRLNIHRKYSLVILKDSPANQPILQKIRNFVAYGIIDQETLALLIEKRGQSIDKKKKIDAAKIAEQVHTKSLSDLGLKPFFRLHPPLGGIDTRLHYGVRKGVLGDNKENINKLIRRML